MSDFSAALRKAKKMVQDYGITAVVLMMRNRNGEISAWCARMASEEIPDGWELGGYVSKTGLVRSAHELFSDANRRQEPKA